MESLQTSACCCSGGVVSLFSAPDSELLEEITDGDVQELLQLMSVTTRDGITGASANSGSWEPDARPNSTSESLKGDPVDLPQLHPSSSTTSVNSGNNSVGTAFRPRSGSARRDPLRSSITVEPGDTPSSPLATSPAQLRQAHVAAATAAGGVKISIPSPSATAALSFTPLRCVSDTAVLDAEQRRWGLQLVQECWMHQELHNVRWNEQRLLKHGAAYRPRAIAARTAVKVTHTKSLCIALNVDTSIIENAGEMQMVDDAEEGASERARMPAMSSPEAEAWSPLLMWRSPASTPGDATKVLSQLSECLSEQYEGLAPRPLPTSCCSNARPSDLAQTLSDARKDAGDAKVIFHYLARGVPPPRGGHLYLMNTASGASGYAGPPYNKLSLDTFRNRVDFPLVFIADCADAREILNYYIRMCEEQHQQQYFTSSREYQLKSSRHVSAAELDNLVDGQMGMVAASGSFDRVGSNADLSTGDNLRRGRGVGGMNSTPPPSCTLLQDFYFIGATGSSSIGGGSVAGGGSLRDKFMGSAGGGGGYDDFAMSSNNLVRGGFAADGGGGGPGGSSASKGNAGALRHHPRLPSDILTSCLTTPLRMAVLWFIAERPELQELHPLLLRLIPGALNDKKTPLGQLQWYLQSIIECIAWSTLSLPEYSRLFREDVYVAPLFRGYILAERIIVGGLDGCLSVYPPLAPTHSHLLWSTWDNLVERACVSVLRAVHPAPPRCTSVLEFRGWLDDQVTSWKYTRPDLLAVPSKHAGALPTASFFGDGGRQSCLPSTPDEVAVIMPSLFTEALRGFQAQLDGLTQQSFERPCVFFADIVGRQLSSLPTYIAWVSGRDVSCVECGSGDECEDGPRSRRQPSGSVRNVRNDTAGQKRPGVLLLRDMADQYSNSLRSSYSAQQQQLDRNTLTPEAARSAGGAVTDATTATSVDELPSGNGGDGVRADRTHRTSPSGTRDGSAEDGKAAKAHEMPERVDSRAALLTGRYQRTYQAKLPGPSDAMSPVARTGGGRIGAATARSRLNPATAVVARMEARRSPSRLSGRMAEYATNLYTTNPTTSGQANSFQYTMGLNLAKGNSDLFVGSPTSMPALAATAAQRHRQHTFPFVDRMPLLLQALLVAAHREKATELICRLVDCGPAAVLQCAEANIYRFVLDRYWSRPDLRFLMPSTLFIYCKSCYADPELIGNPKQRDVAVKACAEILQSPVEVPPLASTGGVAAEEAPGAWQNATLGPYAAPFGQRMLAAALLALISLHSDDGREACHRYGVFQLCCQLLQRTHEDAPLLLMRNLEMAASGASAAAAIGSPNAAPPMPPLPRPPSSNFGSSMPITSSLRAQSRAAAAAPPANTAAAVFMEGLPPPPSIATTYHVTLLTLFVSLLCNWKPAATTAAPRENEKAEGAGEDEDADVAELSPPLDGMVHELPPTTPQVLAAGLRTSSTALLNFTYSDTSILRGAALRCFMMVLISPAPTLQSLNNYIEVVLRFIQDETFYRCELNTDLRLEELGMAYTTFRWLLDQLREDIPIEEIGQYVAVWVYKWFRLNALGKTISFPFAVSALPGGANAHDVVQGGSPQTQSQRQRQQQQSPSFHPSPARTQWMPTSSMSYCGSGVVTPGSVYSHRGGSVLVPAARSVYGGAILDGPGGGGMAGSGLRQHLTQQDHRRLQSCLPPLSNIVRLFFEHTQDACPYVRSYARKVVAEEFGFLHQSWYDEYTVPELHTSPREEDYAGAAGHHHANQRHRSYGGARPEAFHEARISGEAAHGAGEDGGHNCLASADPLTALSMDGGGDLTTYLPLCEMLTAGEVFDGPLVQGGDRGSGRVNGPAAGLSYCITPIAVPPAAAAAANTMADAYGQAAPALLPGLMATEMDGVPDPQPAVLRRFIGQLLRIASTNGSGAAGSVPSFPYSVARHHADGGGRDGARMMMKDGDDDVTADDVSDRGSGRYWRSRRDTSPESGGDRKDEEGYGEERGDRRRPGSLDDTAAHHRGVSGEGIRREKRGEGGYYSFDGDVTDEDTERDLGGTLLDSETLALHPLWAMDSTSMTNFAYGALSFLDWLMLEKMDDGDPRHPMNLKKENALYYYYQRIERNMRAFAEDEMLSTETDISGTGVRGSDGSRATTESSKVEVNDATAGGTRALSSAAAATAPPLFHCFGVGDIGEAGLPGYGQRHSGIRSRCRDSTFAHHPRRRTGRSAELVESGGGSRVSGTVDVVLFHPSEPLVMTSTTGGLLSVWLYDYLHQPKTRKAEEAERANASEDDSNSDAERDGVEEDEEEDEGSAQDGEAAESPLLRQRSTSKGATSSAPPRRLHAKAQFFLRDVAGRGRSDLYHVARSRYMYDRFNPNGEVLVQRGREGPRRQQPQRGGALERDLSRYLYNFHRREGAGAGGGGSRTGAWLDRAEAVNAIAALPSSYQHGHPHYYHGVGDLHLVDAAHHPLICAVRRFGAVEIFSHFADRHRVRRVATFETARLGQNEGMDQCVSSYQSCTGLLYVSNGEGGVSAWDLGNEQRLATLGTLADANSLTAVGSCRVSALKANPYTPYEYLVGSYGKQMCLFDLRDGGRGGAARLGYVHPSSQFVFTDSSPTSRHGSGSSSNGPLSSLCVCVGYSRRYPDAVVAGYACGTVAVWDRRYPKQPSLLFGAALNGVLAGGGGGGDYLSQTGAPGFSGSPMSMEGGELRMIRQLDVHSCSTRFLTLTTTPKTLQLMQLCCSPCDSAERMEIGRASGGNTGGQRRPAPACVVQNYSITTDKVGDGVGDVNGESRNCEPGAACFHDFSPLLGVGIGRSVRLYSTTHLSATAAHMDVDFT